MLTVSHLTKMYGGNNAKVTALKDISFAVDAGSFTAVVGRSGSGKTTLLTLLGALEQPTSGTVELDSRQLEGLSERALTQYRCRTIGFVFQQFQLIADLTVLENVMLPLEFAGMPARQRRERATTVLNEVEIRGAMQSRRPRHLSGGEQQRVAIARALANRPQLILADEPTGNLDSDNGQRIIELLYRLSRTTGTTIIVVTHDAGVAAQCDRVLRLADGRLLPS